MSAALENVLKSEWNDWVYFQVKEIDVWNILESLQRFFSLSSLEYENIMKEL